MVYIWYDRSPGSIDQAASVLFKEGCGTDSHGQAYRPRRSSFQIVNLLIDAVMSAFTQGYHILHGQGDRRGR
jgi:hypothetical protein